MSSALPVKLLLEQRRLIFGFIHALTRDVDASEEIFQEVSLAVLRETGRPSGSERFLPWILTVARHRVADHYRKRNRCHPVPEIFAEAIVDVFEQNAENREEAARRIRGLLECVDHLPPRQRQIVEARYRDRKPVASVAAEIGWKSDAVKVALSKIRRALLGCLRGKELLDGVEGG